MEWNGYECSRRTGYTDPLTIINLTTPMRRTGIDFRKDFMSFGRSGVVRCVVGERTNGIADTMPWENTNEPTPMSI